MGGRDGLRVPWLSRVCGSRLKRIGGLPNDRVRDGLARHFPQCDKAIYGRRKADLEHSELAGGSRGLVIEVERARIVVAPKQDQDVQPVQWVHQADADIDIVFQAVAVIDVE